jgi:flagellar protein FlbD
VQILSRKSVKIRLIRNKVSKCCVIIAVDEILARKVHFYMSRVIELTKLDSRKILINPDMIETVEANPDTVLILYSGRKLLLKEKPEEIFRIINGQ